MKYLKYFEQASAYEAYKNGSDYVLPNVSYVAENNVINYNPYVEPKETRLVCTYNVIDTSSPIMLYSHADFTSMEIDGVMMDNVTAEYAFDSVGEHTIKFELADPTTMNRASFNKCPSLTSVVIPDSVTTISNAAFYECLGLTSVVIGSCVTSIGFNTFYNCSGLTSVVIPDSVTKIGAQAFFSCSGLTSVTIGSGVTFIDNTAFSQCCGLTEIVCHASTAPTIESMTFRDIKTGGVLKAPTGSDYLTWMSTDSYYLGYYNWTIEYI